MKQSEISLIKTALIIITLFGISIAIGAAGYLLMNRSVVNRQTWVNPPKPKSVVTIATDKAEYKQGETVNFNIENNLSEPIFLGGCNQYGLERKKNGQWVSEPPLKVCVWEGIAAKLDSKAKEIFTLEANKAGIFKVSVGYSLDCQENKPVSQAGCKAEDVVYSKEFIIK